jgi:imidazolonepropionase
LPPSYDLVIENISQLVTCDPAQRDGGGEDPRLGLVVGGAVAVSGSEIAYAGKQAGLAAATSAGRVLDGRGLVVLPGFVDCHTHAVFLGRREREYEMRIRGKSYMDIAAAGGGIKQTVKAVRKASEEELIGVGLAHAASMLAWGTTTIEIKSGYGLDLASEMKMLRAIRRIGERARVEVVPTFLGAHEIPEEFAGRRDQYIDLVCGEMIPAVGEARLAEFCDVFCENGVFTPEESRRILTKAKAHGMMPMIHADEFTDSGAAEIAAEVGAVSASHLSHADPAGLEAMRKAGTVATLLPGVGLGLAGGELAEARKIIDIGLDVALATDFNPGSSMVRSLPVITSLACSMMKMTPAEAIIAITLGGAKALAREKVIGSIARGRRADLALFSIPDYRYIPYDVAGSLPVMVVAGGRIALERDRQEAME